MREGAGPLYGLAPSASRHLHRGALLGTLDEGAWLTALVAGPGAGKTALLSAWAATRPAVWLTLGPEHAALSVLRHDLAGAIRVAQHAAAQAAAVLEPPGDDPAAAGRDEQAQAAALASVVAGSLDARTASGHARPGSAGTDDPAPLAVVLDNVHHLPPGGATARFVEELCRHAPRGIRLLVTSRTELPFPVDRLRSAGRLTELRDPDLAFNDFETYQLLTVVLGDAAAADALAAQLHALALGRPGLVALGAAWLAAQPADQRRIRLGALGSETGEGLADFLASQLFAAAEPAAQDLVRHAAYLPRINADLCRAVGLPGTDPGYAVPLLTPVAGTFGWYQVTAGLCPTVRARYPLPPEEREALLVGAARWYARHGWLNDALAVVTATESPEPAVELLTRHGTSLLAAGRATDVAAAAARVPLSGRTPELDLVEGEARHLLGEPAGALACLERLAAGGTDLPAGVAYRIGMIQRLAGDLDAALASLCRARLDDADPADAALVLTQVAAVYWARGELAACREAAGRALLLAEQGGGDRALAAAHSVLSMAAEQAGDLEGNAEHLARAMAAARRAGDLNQQVRLRVNASGRLLEAGRNADALIELDEAMRLIETTGAMDRYAVVRTNRGWAYRAMGRLDEAVAELEAASGAWRDAGSGLRAYALTGLGSVYLVRGDLAQAEATLVEALSLGEATGDHQALAGLSTLARVRYATDPASAWQLTERSIETGLGLWRSWALLTAGWLSLHDGDRAAATRYADEAEQAAGARRDANALAEALELRGWLTEDDAAGAAALREAQLRWTRLGNPIFVARAAAGIAARSGGDLCAAEARLRALGIRPESAYAAGPLRAANAFADVAGLPFLPAARAGLDRFAQGDLGQAQQMLTEAVGRVRDVELTDDQPGTEARDGAEPRAEPGPRGANARAALPGRGADRRAGGRVPRQRTPGGGGEVRAAYLDALRALGSASAAAGEIDVALRWYLRLLEHDPDDEAGHLGVVIMLARSGRHDEARRRYRVYTDRMRFIGIEPAPYPSEWTLT